MKYVICNLKNRLDRVQSLEYKSRIEHIKKTDLKLIVAPSNIYLDLFYPVEYSLASQDISSIKDEVVTGEITAKQLKSIGIEYVIVGHSERRIYKNENSDQLINKILNAQEENLNVIYCVGEGEDQKNNGETNKIIEKQLIEVLDKVNVENIIISYEPVWAIGSGINPKYSEIEQTISYIKELIKEKYNKEMKVIYGGSVNSDNINNLNDITILDGFILGSSSLDIKTLEIIMNTIQ